ncbi:MAG: MBL fold metallo-hydrolase [Oscillospiraceae bacterium]|jgi:L-ascorbate metabolism protein UlaG (beta-lactamase superfamily)|nr:MBL fold metallo-hydrolase [Oscillospiraceae bacterium]
MQNKFRLRWIGQGGYELRVGDKTVYLDPYLSDMVEHSPEGLKRLTPPPILPQNAKPDYFLATHDHMDHLDTDLIRAMDCTGVRFFCPESCKAALLDLGQGIAQAQITVLCAGETVDLGAFSLEAVYADHTPDSIGFVLAVEGFRLYVTGDTLYNARVGAGVAADVICCCVNGKLGNMDAAEAVQVALRSGAKLAIPNHYGMFAENTADPQEFVRLANAAGLKSCVAELGAWLDAAALIGKA